MSAIHELNISDTKKCSSLEHSAVSGRNISVLMRLFIKIQPIHKQVLTEPGIYFGIGLTKQATLC